MDSNNKSEVGSWNTYARQVVSALEELKAQQKETHDKLIQLEMELSNQKTIASTKAKIFGIVWGVVVVAISILMNIFIK